MIKFANQVPSIYPAASRDFQYLCWLMDIVLNSVKHNVDSLYDLPNTKTNDRLTELLAMTLGFKIKRNYDQKQLAALIVVLPRIIKYKGTERAADMAAKALIAASGATGDVDINKDKLAQGELEVSLPKNLIDISLFTDLLPYILPAGMTCRVIRTDRVPKTYTTEISYADRLLAELIPDLDWDRDTQSLLGLARLFNVGDDLSEFANYKSTTDNSTLSNRLNTGLLMNTLIPTLSEPLADPKSGESENVEDENGDNT